MSLTSLRVWGLFGVLLLWASWSLAQSPPTAFTYSGNLLGGPCLPGGVYDMQFQLCPAVTGGMGVTPVLTRNAVTLTNYGFTVTLDFGPRYYDGTNWWLNIAGRPAGTCLPWKPLCPRQCLKPVPIAVVALNAWRLTGNADTNPALHFLGTTDNTPFNIRVNNQRALRIEPTDANNAPNIIGGYSGNMAAPGVVGATIAGGGNAGDGANRVTYPFGTIGGGYDNLVSGRAATVGGGCVNASTEYFATIAGGVLNTANGYSSTIGGGLQNVASGDRATIGGGFANQVSGYFATIPGGWGNIALGSYSFAAGRRANAQQTGAFTWADSHDFDFPSLATNEFAARATGGVRFVSSIDGTGTPISGVVLAPGSGSWSSLSDKAVKANVSPVNPQEVLARLASLPIATWNYTGQSATVRHMGPFAQDFAAAFGVGEDTTHISTVDADGVSLAAIQGLLQLVQSQQTRIDQLEQRLAALEGKQAPTQAVRVK